MISTQAPMIARTRRVLFLRLPPDLGRSRHHPRDVTLPFTIAYAGTMAKRTGREVTVLDVWSSSWTMDRVLAAIRAADPDVVFVDAHAPPFPVAERCAALLKRSSEVRVCAYGSIPTFLPERVVGPGLPFDVAIHGESEATILALLEAFEQGRPLSEVEGIAFHDGAELRRTAPRPLPQDLDELPPVDYDLFELASYRKFSFPMPLHRRVRWGHVLATRGCPYPCTHCSFDHRQSFGPKFRRHSPERVAAEFEALGARGINCVSIEDDIFTLDRKWVARFCRVLLERGSRQKWIVQTRVDCYDRALLELMKAAGCVGLSLGIESGNDRVLGKLQKGFTRRQALEGIRLAQELGFMLRLLFIIGNPSETAAEIRDTIDLACRARAITCQVHICTPYPGTRILDEVDDSKHIDDFTSYDRVVENHSAVPDEELWRLQKEFYRRYYFSPRYLALFARQRLFYLAGSWRHDLPLFLRTFKYLVWDGRKQSERDVEAVFERPDEPALAEKVLEPKAPPARAARPERERAARS